MNRMKFRTKLSIIIVLLIGISVLGAGVITASKLRESHIASLQDAMLRESHIIMATVPWITDGSLQEQQSYFTLKAELLRKQAEARVTFISADGTVLGDSDHKPETMDNHLDRPEIEEARETGTMGYTTRYSETVGNEMLYVAVPVMQGDTVEGYLRLAASLEDVQSHIRKLWSQLITILVVLFAVAGFISYRVALGVTRSLDNITKVALQITHLNYSARVNTKHGNEFGELGQAINQMAESLEAQVVTIHENESRLKNVLDNMVIGVMMIDKDDRIVLINPPGEKMLGFSAKELLGRKYNNAKQQEELTHIIAEGLEKKERVRDEVVFHFPFERVLEINVVPFHQNDPVEWAGALVVLHDISAIRRLERMRSEFVANVSHELKTPIAAVKGFSETLLSGAMEDRETARSFLQIIYDESGRLDRLVADILELSKIESRSVPLQFSPVDLNEFIEKTMNMIRSEAEKKHISLSSRVPDHVFIEADEDRLRQILINLISNAVNYTPNGGMVKVKVETVPDPRRPEREMVRILIKDTGIGIPKKDLPRIFERFYRVDKARSRGSGGTGLGLSIVKHLIELHKGKIEVQSEIGVGSTFIIELPVIQE